MVIPRAQNKSPFSDVCVNLLIHNNKKPDTFYVPCLVFFFCNVVRHQLKIINRIYADFYLSSPIECVQHLLLFLKKQILRQLSSKRPVPAQTWYSLIIQFFNSSLERGKFLRMKYRLNPIPIYHQDVGVRGDLAIEQIVEKHLTGKTR